MAKKTAKRAKAKARKPAAKKAKASARKPAAKKPAAQKPSAKPAPARKPARVPSPPTDVDNEGGATERPERSDRPNLLRCPKCASAMQPFVHEGVELDRCTGCRGLWFDLLEHEDLKKLEGSEVVDIGESSVGRQMNEVDRIQCPICRVDMLRMSDPEQRHIWVESCPRCNGVYFDAGEFTDWKEKDALDWLRSLMSGERS